MPLTVVYQLLSLRAGDVERTHAHIHAQDAFHLGLEHFLRPVPLRPAISASPSRLALGGPLQREPHFFDAVERDPLGERLVAQIEAESAEELSALISAAMPTRDDGERHQHFDQREAARARASSLGAPCMRLLFDLALIVARHGDAALVALALDA